MPIVLNYGTELSFDLGQRASETIGTSTSCSLQLPPSSGLNAEHARLRRVGGRWLLESLGDDLIRVSDNPPSRIVWLIPGSSVEFVESGTELTLAEAGATKFSGASAVASESPLDAPKAVAPICEHWLRPSVGTTLLLAGLMSTVVFAFFFASWRTTAPSHALPPPAVNTAPIPLPSDLSSPKITPVPEPPLPLEPPQGGIVWIGLEGQTRRMLCTGWLSAPDRVITIGQMVRVFEDAQQSGIARLFVYCDAADSRIVGVVAARAHTRSPLDRPDPDFNVAALTLERSLPPHCVCRQASHTELARISKTSALRAFGFAIPLSRDQPPELFDQLNPPVLLTRSVALEAAMQIPGFSGTPTFTLGALGTELQHGWAVCDDGGCIVGMVVATASETSARIIPVDRLSDIPGHR